jgi:serine/threonine protein kinase
MCGQQEFSESRESRESGGGTDACQGFDSFEPAEDTQSEPLGRGSYGAVRKVRRKGTREVFALKTIKKSDVIADSFTGHLTLDHQALREIEVQAELRHQRVLRLYQTFEDADCVHLLLEYCARGELYQIMQNRKTLQDTTARKYFVQVAEGLSFLHGRKIVHRDIKPENILVSKGDQVKIADFGWSALLRTSAKRMTFCGTLDYMAPEMITRAGHDHTLDIWSLGVLLYEMIAGQTPFQSSNHGYLIHCILHQDLPANQNVGEQLMSLIRALLRKQPDERLPLDKAMDHPWVGTRHNLAPDKINSEGRLGGLLRACWPFASLAFPRRPAPGGPADALRSEVNNFE